MLGNQICYVCHKSATNGIHLLQGWEATCDWHYKEAKREEPGIQTCEIEELEVMKRGQSKIA